MSYDKLPIDVLGRIGDFLTPRDRAMVRQTSRTGNIVFSNKPAYEYLVRNTFSVIHLKTGRTASITTSESKLQQNKHSSEIGTTNQRERSLQKTAFLNLTKIFEQQNFNFFDFLTDGQQLPDDVEEEWDDIKHYIISYLFKTVSERVVVSESELNYHIQQRSTNGYPFPLTFVKVNEINLLDYAIVGRAGYFDFRPVRVIDDLVDYMLEGFDDYYFDIEDFEDSVKNIFTEFLHGEGTTSIEPLKEFFTCRFTHEIHIEKQVPE